MIMICNVPDETVKNVKMGTWCGSSVAEEMIANGVPLDKIRDEILDNAFSVVNPHNTYEYINIIDIDSIDEILDKYKPSIKAVMGTIALEQEPSKGEKTNETDKEIHGVREELKAIAKELHNLNRIQEKRKMGM